MYLTRPPPPGRVLIGQGMSDYGVNFNNGSTGGEYSHTLSQQELPSFNISGNTSTAGNHNHKTGWGEHWPERAPYGVADGNNEHFGADGSDWDNIEYLTSVNGAHTHTVSLSFNSQNKSFKTISPYLVVYIWKRKA